MIERAARLRALERSQINNIEQAAGLKIEMERKLKEVKKRQQEEARKAAEEARWKVEEEAQKAEERRNRTEAARERAAVKAAVEKAILEQ